MGRLIVLMGADAVGKTSVAAELAKLLGAPVRKTPGPAFDGLRVLAEDVTPYLRYCFYMATVGMTAKEIPELIDCCDVIFDRYIQCTAAFHHALGVEIPDKVWELTGVPEPTLSVHLTVSPKVACERIKARPHGSRPDSQIEANAGLQRQVVEAYRTLFSGNEVPKGFRPVEISTDGKTPREVALEIFGLLS